MKIQIWVNHTGLENIHQKNGFVKFITDINSLPAGTKTEEFITVLIEYDTYIALLDNEITAKEPGESGLRGIRNSTL